ncbi:MAG: sporulation integral membrane protein YtvI [Clostridiales bacterium]|nr:sporulation integral membrane protein YtvI [Clostridiales bacterium]
MDIFLNLDIKKLIFLFLKILFVSLIMVFVVRISIYFVPFIVAFIISLIIDPIVNFFNKKLKFNRKIASFVCLIAVFFLLGWVLFLGVSKIILELSNLSHNIPMYSEIITKNIEKFTSYASDFYFSLPEKITLSVEKSFLEISNSLSIYLDVIVKTIVNTAISLPNAFIFFLVTIVSTYFFVSDKELIFASVRNTLPKKLVKFIHIIKTESFSATNAYIRSQLIIASITTIQVIIGFSILRMKNILTLSILFFILDLLPLIGVGGVLIPWGIYEFIFDSPYQGSGLLLLYMSILIIRNLTEPKILSTQIGFHPLIVLMSMYVGFKLIGVMGLILGPLTIMFSRNIFVELFKSCSSKNFKELLIKNLCTDTFFKSYHSEEILDNH